jgi:hypothetical protein
MFTMSPMIMETTTSSGMIGHRNVACRIISKDGLHEQVGMKTSSCNSTMQAS